MSARRLLLVARNEHWSHRGRFPGTDNEPLAKVVQLLRDEFKLDFSQYKNATIERRIARRMSLGRIERLSDYVRFLEKESGELAALYRDLLINVTSFFRDREPFEHLKKEVFPRLFEGRSFHRPVRMWVPGCATGEEAYSIAITALEVLDRRIERHEGVAIAVVHTRIAGEFMGTPFDGPFRYTRTWMHGEGGWRVVAGSVCPIIAR